MPRPPIRIRRKAATDDLFRRDRAVAGGEWHPDGPFREPTHGNRARLASGVFDTLDSALAWAAEHHVTGILAEYPFGGAYDIAVSEGRFTPSKAHHGIADHVSTFSPGLRHFRLTGGRSDE